MALGRSSLGLAVGTVLLAGSATSALVSGWADAVALHATGQFAFSFALGLLGGALLWFL